MLDRERKGGDRMGDGNDFRQITQDANIGYKGRS